MPENNGLRSEIRAYRERHGLSQRAMGERLNLKHPQESIWDWENGRTPRPAMLAKLRELLDADVKTTQSETVEYYKERIARLVGVPVEYVEIKITM
jgi:transcriptional regulator with XRE-family HTH domain